MSKTIVVTLVVSQHDVGYLQPVCLAVCSVIPIFHNVKHICLYAENKIILIKSYLLGIYAKLYCEYFVLFKTVGCIGHFR